MAPDRRLATRGWGEGRPAVLCWPGLTITAPAHFDEAGPRWAELLGRRVVAVEPPGWLDRPLAPGEYRLPALAERVVAFLDELGAERIAYVGWSWGASIGCHLAGRAPERLSALVLLDAGFTDLQDDPAFEERSMEELVALLDAQDFRFGSWEAYLEVMRSRTRSWRPALEERARAAMREQDGELVPHVPRAVMAAAFHGVGADPPSLALPALADGDGPPTLLVAAEETLAQAWARAALDRFRAAVPGAEVLTVDASHDMLADAPEETIAAVAEWLRGRLPSSL